MVYFPAKPPLHQCNLCQEFTPFSIATCTGPSAELITLPPLTSRSYSSSVSLSALSSCFCLSLEVPPTSMKRIGGPTWLMKNWFGRPFLFYLQWGTRAMKFMATMFFVDGLEKDKLLVVGINWEVQHKKTKPLLPVNIGITLFEIWCWVERLQMALDNSIPTQF